MDIFPNQYNWRIASLYFIIIFSLLIYVKSSGGGVMDAIINGSCLVKIIKIRVQKCPVCTDP